MGDPEHALSSTTTKASSLLASDENIDSDCDNESENQDVEINPLDIVPEYRLFCNYQSEK